MTCDHLWPSVIFPLVRHIEVWHCGSGWCCCSRKVPEPNSHVAFVPLFRNFPSSEPTAATVCIVCAGIQLHWRHLRGRALPCLPKKTVPVIAAHSPQIIIESVPRHFQTSLNLSRLPLLLRNRSRLRLFQLSRFGQEVQFYQGFTRYCREDEVAEDRHSNFPAGGSRFQFVLAKVEPDPWGISPAREQRHKICEVAPTVDRFIWVIERGDVSET